MTEKPMLGIVLMLATTVAFSCSDAMSKSLITKLPAIEIAWIRYMVFTAMAGLWLLREPIALRHTRRPLFQSLRGLGILGSSLFFILALGNLPLAEAAAVSFASPLFITLLAIPLLREAVDARAWLALLGGFAGVLIVVRPGTGGFHPAVLLVVASSLAWALGMIVGRTIRATERASVTLWWTASVGLILLTAALPFVWVTPAPGQLLLALAAAVVASSGQFFAVMAYRHAPASVLAPLSYAQLLWSGTLSFLVFGQAPDRATVLGALVIAACGFYTVNRARLRARAGLPLAGGAAAALKPAAQAP